MTIEDRFQRIEAKLAYQEDLVTSLNDTVVDQQRQIGRLEARVHDLMQRLQAAGTGGSGGFVSEAEA